MTRHKTNYETNSDTLKATNPAKIQTLTGYREMIACDLDKGLSFRLPDWCQYSYYPVKAIIRGNEYVLVHIFTDEGNAYLKFYNSDKVFVLNASFSNVLGVPAG